jgi:hypothetical protein
MKELVRLGVFLVFLGLGLRVALAGPDVRRKRVNALLIYVLCVSGVAGLTQRDSWPFAAYRIFYHTFFAGHVSERLTLRVVDRAGHECETAPHFPSPVTLPVLLEWLERTYPSLSEPQQQQVIRFLFVRAQEAEERAASSQNSAILRGLHWLAPPTHWALYARPSPDDFLRCVPYGGLRLYRDVWQLSDTLQDSQRVARHLVSEYRTP